MNRYFTRPPKPVEGALMPMWGCYIFTNSRTMAIGQGFGRTAEEAHDQAHCIIGAMLAVEDKPAVAAKARHYIVRSPKLETGGIMEAPRADADLLEQYDRYYEMAEQRYQRSSSVHPPMTFDEWKAKHHD